MKIKCSVFVSVISFLSLISSLHTVIAQKKTSGRVADQPNIVWIVIEDQSDFIPSFGDSTVKTPNISSLAEEGIRFTNAYSTSGVCAPSRAALITGMYATSIGADNMRVDGDPKYLPSTIVPYSVVPPPDVKFYSEFLRKAGYYTINNGKSDYQIETPVTAWDENYGHGGPEFDAPLWQNRPDGHPFFAAINISTTHESKIWDRADKPMLVDPDSVPVPPLFPDTPIVRRDIARNYSNIKVMDGQVGEVLDQLKADGLMDDTVIFFYSDHGGPFPRYKREVYDTGLNIPLIIRFPDQRKMGTIDDQLVSFVDFAPTLLSLAHIPIPAYMEGKAFLGDQKAPARKYIYAARDRMDAQYDMVRTVRDKRYQYVRNYQPEKPFMQNIAYRKNMPMMRQLLEFHQEGKLTDVQKLWFRDTKPVEELYDTQEDPYELNNLANDSAYSDKLNELRAALHKWERETKDWGFTPEYQMLNRMWPDQTQPITKPVQFYQDNQEGTVSLKSNTKGASIAYQITSSGKRKSHEQTKEMDINEWNVYTNALDLPSNTTIKAVAIRYGYKQSEEKTFTVK